MLSRNAIMVQRHNPASVWTSNNPILLHGEMGVETDTNRIKVGDGTTRWVKLPYYFEGGSIGEYTAGWSITINSSHEISTVLDYEVKS